MLGGITVVWLHRIHKFHQYVIIQCVARLLLAVVDPPIVVLDQLLNETLIFVQYLLAHIRNVVKNRLIFYKKVLLCGTPCVEPGQCLHYRHQ